MICWRICNLIFNDILGWGNKLSMTDDYLKIDDYDCMFSTHTLRLDKQWDHHTQTVHVYEKQYGFSACRNHIGLCPRYWTFVSVPLMELDIYSLEWVGFVWENASNRNIQFFEEKNPSILVFGNKLWLFYFYHFINSIYTYYNALHLLYKYLFLPSCILLPNCFIHLPFFTTNFIV